MSSVIDLEAQQVAEAAPRAGAFFSLFLITVIVVMGRKEEVEGAETHEMDTLGPNTSGVASSLQSLSAGQDINDEARLAVPQVEGVTAIWPGCRISRQLFCSVTGSGVSDALGMPASIINSNSDQSRACDSHTRLIQTSAQGSACFLTIV